MGLDGRAVANFILDFCEARERRISNLTLQKIVYFCHVWSLIKLRRPLLRHQFEAWKFGPVLQYLYREFKKFGDDPIKDRATRINPLTGEKVIVEYEFDKETEKLLYKVVNFYSQLSANDLVTLSHTKGAPWEEVWNHQGRINPGMKIDDNSIMQYYSKMRSPFTIQ